VNRDQLCKNTPTKPATIIKKISLVTDTETMGYFRLIQNQGYWSYEKYSATHQLCNVWS